MGNIYLFSPFGSHLEYLAQFFKVIIGAYCNTNPRRHHIFSNVLEPDGLPETFTFIVCDGLII